MFEGLKKKFSEFVEGLSKKEKQEEGKEADHLKLLTWVD